MVSPTGVFCGPVVSAWLRGSADGRGGESRKLWQETGVVQSSPHAKGGGTAKMFQRGLAGLTPNAKLHAAGFCPPGFLSLEYLMALHERKSSSLVPGTPAGREAAPSQPWVHTHVVKEPVAFAVLCTSWK